VYSILGFLLESSVYKFKLSSCYSGILFGPFTIIYGFGCIFLMILDNNVFKKIQNKFLKVIVVYVLSAIILTLTELSGGLILKYLFHTEMWDYTNKLFNIGKYICLELSITWGLLGVIFIYIVKPFFDKILKSLSHNFTKIFMSLIIINLIITFLIYNKELIMNFL
jgi:uncharacterized membrane protein